MIATTLARIRYAGVLGLLLLPALAASATLGALTSKEAANGLKAALSQGIDIAVAQLGKRDGFLLDPKAVIPLPSAIERAERAMRLLGRGGQADELKIAMNRAAEDAVREARPIFRSALQKMTLADAKSILAGGNDAGTQYFRRATNDQLVEKFRPIVAKAVAKTQIAPVYERYASQAASIGLMKREDANLNDYVTTRALDRLFGRIAEQEQEIRSNPLNATTSLLRKVFGAAKQ